MTRRRQLALVAVVQVLAMATWFSASAVVPAIRADWGVGARDATWLTGAVQLGFVAGAVTSGVLNLPDRVPIERLIAGSAFLAAAVTASVAAFADSLVEALPLRFLTGFALAGVYPPSMKLIATWFDRGRGLALGVIVGALTLGSAVPHLLVGAELPWKRVMYLAAALAFAGGVLALAAARPGPLATPTPPFDPRYAFVLFRDPEPRLATIGYLGHMWELYAMWTWLPAYFAASLARNGGGWQPDPRTTAFFAIGVAGIVGCVFGGYFGDRFGRAGLASAALATSSACCFGACALYGAPAVVVVPLLLVWGAAVIADSGLFSTCISSSVDPRYIGTALTTQVALGFLLTVLTIQVTPTLVDTSGWRLVAALLGIGPAIGMVAMARLHALTSAKAAAA
jgi:MFS family permease